MDYESATPINKLRAIAAYCGTPRYEEERVQWLIHRVAGDDAALVLKLWEASMDEGAIGAGWRSAVEKEQQKYLNGD